MLDKSYYVKVKPFLSHCTETYSTVLIVNTAQHHIGSIIGHTVLLQHPLVSISTSTWTCKDKQPCQHTMDFQLFVCSSHVHKMTRIQQLTLFLKPFIFLFSAFNVQYCIMVYGMTECSRPASPSLPHHSCKLGCVSSSNRSPLL